MYRKTITRLTAAGAGLLLAVSGVWTGGAHAYSTNPSPAWTPGGPVHAVTVHGGTTYIGGTFGIAAVDATTGQLRWSVPTDGDVWALDVTADGSRLLAGGGFLTVDGQSRRRLVALSTAGGAVISPWRAAAAGVVRDIVIVNDVAYVAGQFASLNGVAKRSLGAVRTSDGVRVAEFTPSTDRIVYGLALHSGALVIAGNFTTVNGAARTGLASVSLGAGQLTPWAPARLCTSCSKFWDVATDGQRAYVAAGGQGANRLGAFSLTANKAVWNVPGNGDVQAVAVNAGLVYAGGHFRTFSGVARTQLAAVSASTGSLNPGFAPKMVESYPGVWAMVATPSALYVGGNFAGVNRRGNSPFFAIFR
jgi:PQQ enzyme repeat